MKAFIDAHFLTLDETNNLVHEALKDITDIKSLQTTSRQVCTEIHESYQQATGVQKDNCLTLEQLDKKAEQMALFLYKLGQSESIQDHNILDTSMNSKYIREEKNAFVGIKNKTYHDNKTFLVQHAIDFSSVYIYSFLLSCILKEGEGNLQKPYRYTSHCNDWFNDLFTDIEKNKSKGKVVFEKFCSKAVKSKNVVESNIPIFQKIQDGGVTFQSLKKLLEGEVCIAGREEKTLRHIVCTDVINCFGVYVLAADYLYAQHISPAMMSNLGQVEVLDQLESFLSKTSSEDPLEVVVVDKRGHSNKVRNIFSLLEKKLQGKSYAKQVISTSHPGLSQFEEKELSRWHQLYDIETGAFTAVHEGREYPIGRSFFKTLCSRGAAGSEGEEELGLSVSSTPSCMR